jgi:hypothetical protein
MPRRRHAGCTPPISWTREAPSGGAIASPAATVAPSGASIKRLSDVVSGTAEAIRCSMLAGELLGRPPACSSIRFIRPLRADASVTRYARSANSSTAGSLPATSR